MQIKLDKSVIDAIDSNYQIEPSVFREIEQRRQSSEAAQNSTTNTLQDAPTKPVPPEKSSNASTQIINDANYDIKLDNTQLKVILDSLLLLDVSIDKIDEVIKKLDVKALPLIDEINTAVKKLEQAHSKIIESGCKSNLIWSFIGSTSWIDQITLGQQSASTYEVVKDPTQIEFLRYYGIRYYQKPSNRDYGFNIISEFNGSILVGSHNLTVLAIGATTGLTIGDEITDNLSSPEAFNVGSLPTIVGFGVTSILGITTTIRGNVTLGSNTIEYVGIGLTENILIGDYVVNIDLFESDTQVIGFGTTTTIITYNDIGTSTFISTSIVVPGVILNKVSIGSKTNSYFNFGSYIEYNSINLSSPSNVTLNNHLFTAIRKTEDIATNFDYTNSPIDPITVGIINNQRIGLGNKTQLVNNQSNPGPAQWRQVLGESEPNVGAGTTSYYTGQELWPYNVLVGYALEGTIHNFSGIAIPSYTSISPTGVSNSTCTSYMLAITAAENNLQNIINKNVPQIETLISASIPLRKSRDKYESQAWAYLQSASYLRSETSNLQPDIDSLNNFDYNSL